jgi:glycosyltransferase involved in cell wall biosynthesis
MPFRIGGGTRLKLIEAMASGRAIVSTSVGSEGFQLQSGKQLVIADEPAEFAAAVLALLGDPQRRRELGAAASQFAQQYDWRVVSPRFYHIIDDLLADS